MLDNPTTGAQQLFSLPKGRIGGPFTQTCLGVVDAVRDGTNGFGPLRSLRVLYENGWWLRLDLLNGPLTTAIHDWLWYLHQEQDAPEIPHGRFTEDKDSEAVERGMIAAAAFFSQRQD